MSNFACEVPFELTTKAVTPITGVGLPWPYSVLYGPPQPALRVSQLMMHVPVAGGAVMFTEETGFTPGADLVPEGTVKPATAISFTNKTLPVLTAATIAKPACRVCRILRR